VWKAIEMKNTRKSKRGSESSEKTKRITNMVKDIP